VVPDYDFDVIVIGSGFGGSVMTCRLSERGHRVCLLERGKAYGMYEFPRRMEDVRERVFWDPDDGKFGFIEIRDYPKSDVASVSASGLGGGSLIYANVLMRMPAEHFKDWPGEITRTRLDPFYDRAIEMLEASPYPFETDTYYADTPKTAALKAAVSKVSASDDATVAREFVLPHLAIRFEGAFPGHQTPNRQGVIQSRCIKCGECDLGCNIHAKNTLDLNYLARARQLPGTAADIRTRAEVREIRPLRGGGYEVAYADPEYPLDRQSVTANRVVVSAGSVGSTGLLLRMKRDGLLPQLSGALGRNWCGNGDLEGTVLFTDDHVVPTTGPVITAAVQYRFATPYPDGFPHGAVIQDAGFPPFIAWYLVGKLPSIRPALAGLRLAFRAVVRAGKDLLRMGKRNRDLNIGTDIADLIDRDDYVRRTFVLLGMGRDRSDGRIELQEDGEPVIKWRIDASRLHYDRVRSEMKKIARALGGRFVENPLSRFHKVIAVHPLGGCAMANSERDGVVDANGEAFGHPGLYVVDASILPTSVGINPSLTIAAVAEYIAERFPEPDRREG
jgi:cholesterol oxidase